MSAPDKQLHELASANYAEKLRDLALERARYEYTELAENWKQIDSKAQATAATAGVFLAAAFAFANNVPKVSDMDPAMRYLMQGMGILLVVFLTTSVCLAVGAMLVKSFDMPPASEDVWREVKELLPGEVDERVREFEYDRILRTFTDEWVEVNVDLNKANGLKADRVKNAQRFLLASAVISALLAMLKFAV